MDAKKIGAEIKKYFEEQGITQESVARKTNVSRAYVNALLNGKGFGKKTAQTWSNLLGLSATWLLTGEGDMFVTSTEERSNTGNVESTGDIKGDHNTVAGGNVVNGVPAANIPSWLPTTSDSDSEVIEAEEVPFISKPIIESRETDIRSYIERGDAKTIIPQGLIQGGASYARKIYSDAMAPDIREGDIVLCTFVPDTSNLVDGDIYAVDTTKYGCVIRDIYHDGTGIILRARNHKYPELRVEQNEITSVATPMQLIRSTFSQRTDYAKIIRDKDERIELLVTREFDHIRHTDRLLEQLDKASARQDKLIEMLEKK